MIKIVVNSEEELKVVRRILKTESCSHNTCPDNDNSRCDECIVEYCADRVSLYKTQIVEVPVPFVL